METKGTYTRDDVQDAYNHGRETGIDETLDNYDRIQRDTYYDY